MNFVNMLMELTKEYESPSSFWKWSAYAAIAATVRNNVYFQHGLGRMYPNIYTLLLADSAESRKDAPMRLASELLRGVGNTKVIEGRSTHQGIADALSYDVANKATGVAIKGGCAIVMGPEFSAAFVTDPSLISVLTDWYDYRDIDYINLKMGKTVIKDRCINVFAASNETLLKSVYTESAVYGGLIRRTFFIKPDEIRPPNSLFEMQPYDKKPLVEALKSISQMKGQVIIEKEAIKIYNDWYYNLYRSYKVSGDKTGVLQSLHTSALKLAIIKAVDLLQLIITKEVIEESINEVDALKANYRSYSMGVGRSDLGEITKIILMLLFQAPNFKLTRRAILQTLWSDVSAEDLDKVFATLQQGGLVEVSTGSNGSEPKYILTSVALNQLKG